jgi:hypothetical protein
LIAFKRKLRNHFTFNTLTIFIIFLAIQRSLQLKKKAFDRTITELERKAAEEAVANEVFEKLGDMVREREGIERKLSTTYSLGRDRSGSKSKSLLPIHDGKTRSYSFQGEKKESVTIFHTLSDTSSKESSSSEKETSLGFHEEQSAAKAKAKAKAPIEAETSSNDGTFERDLRGSPSETTSSSGGVEFVQTDSRLRLTRRKTLSSTN